MSLSCSFFPRRARALGLAALPGPSLPLLAAERLSDAVIDQQAAQPITADQVATMRVAEGSILPSPPATIKSMNRPVATLRSSAQGWSAKTRVEVSEARIARMLAKGGDHSVSLLDRKEGTAVLVDDELMFAVLLQDTVEGTARGRAH